MSQKLHILSLGRFGAMDPITELDIAEAEQHFAWEHLGLNTLTRWNHSKSELKSFDKILVDLDALEETQSLQNEQDFNAWKSALNSVIQETIDQNEGTAPQLIAFTRQPSWSKGQMAVRLGARQLFEDKQLGQFLIEQAISPFAKKETDNVIDLQIHRDNSKAERHNGVYEHNPAFNQISSHSIPFPIEGLEGESRAVVALRERVRKVAQTKSSVLIQGPTGSGKDKVARTIHTHSPVFQGAFVTLDCGAINPNLFESEIFGHVEGAFTDAAHAREGVFARAHNGTLFIDQIHLLDLQQQSKLLRALQSKTFTPIGGNDPQESNFRLICSTQVNLMECVQEGSFREDLYYRVNVIDCVLPSLNERRRDIPTLCESTLKRLAKNAKKPPVSISNSALEKLLLHDWPGNIRELEHVMEKCSTLLWVEGRGEIELSDLPESVQFAAMKKEQAQNLKDAVKRFEKEYIAQTVQRLGGSKEEAADILGLSLATLYRKLGS